MVRKKIITVILLFAIALLSCINTRYLGDVLLNHIGTIVILCLLLVDAYCRFLSYTSFFCISLFCFFQILGARYVYSNVPYNEWLVTLFKWDMNSYFQFTRNHYDRFVHFIFGILMFPFLMEWFTRKSKMNYSYSILFSWLSIQTFSMVYEIIEWIVALTLSAKSAENYNGQQGDIWDAHKDMALALISSAFMCICYFFKRKSYSAINH